MKASRIIVAIRDTHVRVTRGDTVVRMPLRTQDADVPRYTSDPELQRAALRALSVHRRMEQARGMLVR